MYTLKNPALSAATSLHFDAPTAQDAVGNNFQSIIRSLCPNIGNPAGYTLDRVWFDAQQAGMTTLHIIAHGDDGLIDYDPYTDEPQEYAIEIAGLQPDELTEETEVTLTSTPHFNPMTCPLDKIPQCMGSLKAIVDYIAANHTIIHEDLEPSLSVATRFPLSERNRTQIFVSQLLLCLTRRRVKNTKAASALVKRMDELVAALSDVHSLTADEWSYASIFYWQSLAYFRKQDEETALARFRRNAGMTQEQLAEAVGLSRRQIISYENTGALGNAKPIVIQRLADALHVQPRDLVRGCVAVTIQKA